MPLALDLITPAELTGYARASQDAYERANGSLARWLPNRLIPDISVRAVVGRNGMRPALAQYRSWDAETPLGKHDGGRRITIELPPVGLKERVSEYEQLRARGSDGPQILGNLVDETAERIAAAVADRIEIERGKALEHALVDIDEGGFRQTASWDRDPASTITPAKPWTDPTSQPVDDLTLWRDRYVERNGQPPGALLTSSKVFSVLQRHQQFRDLFATMVGSPSLVSRDAVNSVLAGYGLPPLTVFDRQVMHADEVVRKVLSPEKLFLLPTEGGSQLGATMWGQTLESSEPDYGIAEYERPGIVVGAWRTQDPIAVWVHAAAISLPVLLNPDLSAVATVLPSA